MKKNEIYEGIVTELKFPNKGKVIVKNEMLNIREPQMLSKWILGGKEC